MSDQVWSAGMTLEEAEKNIIERALQFYYYNKTMTANSLGISVRGLDGKMEKLKIPNKKKELYENIEVVTNKTKSANK